MNVVHQSTDEKSGNMVLWFFCQGCEGYHQIPVSIGTRRHPGTIHKDKTWKWDGSLEKPTVEPSINMVGKCHYFMRNGNIEYCGDSKHKYAGQTVPLPEFTDW